MTRKLLRLVLLVLAGAGCVGAQAPQPPAASPKASASPVQSAAVVTFLRPLAADEARFIADHFAWIAPRTRPAGGRQTGEEAFAEFTRTLKQANPAVKVLFYWNSTLYAQSFRASRPFDLGWCSRKGTERDDDHGCTRDGKNRVRFERSNPKFRQWWVQVAVDAVKAAGADGVFVDAAGRNFDPNLVLMVDQLKAALKPTGRDLIVFNGGSASYPAFASYDKLASTDGFFFERFDQFENTGPDNLKADLLAVRDAGLRGRIVAFKAWPGFVDLQSEFMDEPDAKAADYAKSNADRVARARASITFPLACFLAVAHPRAYFQYGWSYREPGGGTLLYDGGKVDPAWYPELLRPLGAAKNAPQIDGYVFTRSYERAEVRCDVGRHEGRIDWR